MPAEPNLTPFQSPTISSFGILKEGGQLQLLLASSLKVDVKTQ